MIMDKDVFQTSGFVDRNTEELELHEEESTRKLTIGKRDYTILKKDPFDLWYISTKGPLPKALKGAFTSLKLAQDALTLHYNSADKV